MTSVPGQADQQRIMMKWTSLAYLSLPGSVMALLLATMFSTQPIIPGSCCLVLMLLCIYQLWWTRQRLDHERLLNAFHQYANRHSERWATDQQPQHNDVKA